MGIKQKPSAQLITYAKADAIAKQLTAGGFTVANIREIEPSGTAISVTDPNWENDGGTYQYIASISGPNLPPSDQELGLIAAAFEASGQPPFSVLFALVESMNTSTDTNATALNAYNVILGLPGVMDALNGLFAPVVKPITA